MQKNIGGSSDEFITRISINGNRINAIGYYGTSGTLDLDPSVSIAAPACGVQNYPVSKFLALYDTSLNFVSSVIYCNFLGNIYGDAVTLNSSTYLIGTFGAAPGYVNNIPINLNPQGIGGNLYYNNNTRFFFAKYTNSFTTPVRFRYFNAKKEGENVRLKWVTASESFNDYFNIEKSKDGSNFYSLTKIEAMGTTDVETEYEFMDELPYSGDNFYRIKQVDMNMKYNYTPVEHLLFNRQDDLSMNPNPCKDHFYFIGLKPNSNVYIYELSGKLLKTYAMANDYQLLSTSDIPKGNYIVIVKCKHVTCFNKKLTVN